LLVLAGAASRASGGADYRQHRQRFECGAGDEDTLGVRALVRRVDQVAFRQVLGQVGGHEAFEDFIVLEAEADPEAFGAGAGGEGFASEGFGVSELADEVDAVDLTQLYGDDRPGGVEQFEFAFVDELRGGDLAGDGVAIHLADDYFFVGRGHGYGRRSSAVGLRPTYGYLSDDGRPMTEDLTTTHSRTNW